ncbi:MAG TPA: prepilin-type N-terminal cleavage/methylation domain-containing protein [Bacillota bacterium]|nr:prepilin-type N-terminal cleavage/methylation domain-containing protein [Bacillota bacterium]
MTKRSKGFSAIELLVVLVVVLAAGFGGWYIWHKNQNKSTAKQPSSSNNIAQNSNNQQNQQQSDPYEGWKNYSNATYGINFKYPADWKVEEIGDGSVDSSSTSPLTAQFVINLKYVRDVRYPEAASIQVLTQDITDAAAYYDESFGQAPSNPVTKTTNSLKGKQSVQYSFPGSDAGEKDYLFAVGNKAYLFSSAFQETHIQIDRDTNYWTTFDKVFDSFQITK